MPSVTERTSQPCFFYGSLMEPRVLNAVTRPKPGTDLFIVRASVKGYTRYTYHNQPFPGMIVSKDPNEIVEGLLVFGHSDAERRRLDQFEGPEYPRTSLPVTIHGQVPARFTAEKQQSYEAESTVDAFVYLFTGPLEHLDLNRPWDYEAFKRDNVVAWTTADDIFKSMILRSEE
ncbi:hypothetical protein BC939DRAFT_502701 [Gamsiella multidivaricata]|uniref:uncharacterized protein n=1 Tax=Gamsiella multidivaricata TaxID=101098 RepID=UPI00221FD522|nr:uncharacterized protein BC939DRAFT_502701 [Gamsiella multidivaricata]KAG0367340.1 hypothetical protein BGZ54_004003 [Gamsiella multidivaricata]KAI7824726.1 hypothetical protein BC939DRAFT_502701 [Gamsiella multidivaricata]